MFRCTECKTEYDIKPDYCDCGNDTFEEIVPQKEIKFEPVKEIKKQEIQIKTEEKIQKKKTIKPQKPFFEPISTIIFSVCIILSFIIIFFVGNPKPDNEIAQNKQETKTTTNIPNIDKFWNNSLPKAETPTIEPKQQQTITTYIPQTQPKVVTKPKIIQKTQPTKKVVQPKVTTKVQPKQQPQTKTVQQKTPQQKPNPQTTTTQPTPKVQTVAPQQPVINKQELANYKINLRNKIANKINFVNVIGDGTCSVSFNISANGTLQNKKFKKQSDNFTLNDAVYNAVMQTTSYNPPPYGYKNETMTLTVKMYNGNFEVTLN